LDSSLLQEHLVSLCSVSLLFPLYGGLASMAFR
jgi:hypothetical protein